MNIIIRALMYMVQTYHDYFDRTKQNLYKSKKVKLPIPEIYVIYTGDRKTRPSEVSLAQEFFEGKQSCIDVKVKMIYDGEVEISSTSMSYSRKYATNRWLYMEGARKQYWRQSVSARTGMC